MLCTAHLIFLRQRVQLTSLHFLQFTIGEYEIKPAGMRGRDHRVRGTGEGIAEIASIDEEAIVGQVYFEVHPDRLTYNNINVELYGKTSMGVEDCSTVGEPLARTKMGGNVFQRSNMGPALRNEFSSSVSKFPLYNDMYRDYSFECHPRATNAIMAAVAFTITDPFGESVREQLWVPENEQTPGTEGEFLYCIRVNIEPPVMSPGQRDNQDSSEDKWDNYIDTKFRIEGDREKINTFGQDSKSIRIFSTKPINSKDAYVLKQDVKVDAFPCKIPDGTVIASPFPVYSIGQELSICVGPTEEFVEHFEVVGFENVVCENSGQSRKIIEDGDNDFLTTVDTSQTMYTNIMTGDVVHNKGVLAFATKITMGMVQRGDTSTVCSGEVMVQSKSGHRNRNLEELEELEREERPATSEFTLTIALARLDVAAFSGSQPSYRRSQRLWFLGFSIVLPAVFAVANIIL